MSDIERHLETLIQILSLLALLLYLAPAAFGREIAAGHRPWMHRAAIVTLTAGVVVALVATARWFMRSLAPIRKNAALHNNCFAPQRIVLNDRSAQARFENRPPPAHSPKKAPS